MTGELVNARLTTDTHMSHKLKNEIESRNSMSRLIHPPPKKRE